MFSRDTNAFYIHWRFLLFFISFTMFGDIIISRCRNMIAFYWGDSKMSQTKLATLELLDSMAFLGFVMALDDVPLPLAFYSVHMDGCLILLFHVWRLWMEDISS